MERSTREGDTFDKPLLKGEFSNRTDHNQWLIAGFSPAEGGGGGETERSHEP